MYMQEEVGPWHMKHPSLRFSGGQMKDRHEKHCFSSLYICKAKYLTNFYFNLSDQALHKERRKTKTYSLLLHSKQNSHHKKKQKQPPTNQKKPPQNETPKSRPWNWKGVNKSSRGDFTYH